VAAVVQKPRTFYIADGAGGQTPLGSPAFLLNGKILGVFVVRAVSAGGDAPNTRQNLTSIILPAEDILKAARQAPDVKSVADKPAEAKEAAEQKSGDEEKK
jgi:hypothetical protein